MPVYGIKTKFHMQVVQMLENEKKSYPVGFFKFVVLKHLLSNFFFKHIWSNSMVC